MKILQVNTVIRSGSVGRITADLYETINASGNEALVAVGREPFPENMEGILIGNQGDFYRHVLKNFFQGESGFGSADVTKRFLAWMDREKPDLIHLHNIHGFYIQVELLFEYIKKRNIPVVWTLHDCWSFTGHCAYYDYAACDKWKEGCNNCIHHAKVYPYALFKDNSIEAYKRKRTAFCGVKDLTIVTPSHWLKGQVEQSFLKEYPVKVIHNGIDLDVFCPGTKQQTKDKKIVLGVANIWEHRKGLSYFEKMANDLSDEYEIQLIGVSKKQKKELEQKYKGKIKAMMRTSSIEELAEAYRNADVFVNATLEDNFPTTNLEALACGTPVVTYATGGSGESVSEKTGIVVQRANYQALLLAVVKACVDGAFDSEECRKRAEEYDKHKRYEEYLELYREILDR
ncbi:MAG: glycosyltransferase [Lachnospiraceae bacterium]|nr:glycosyltransferase [Lachnospiraceae bacterium]